MPTPYPSQYNDPHSFVSNIDKYKDKEVNYLLTHPAQLIHKTPNAPEHEWKDEQEKGVYIKTEADKQEVNQLVKKSNRSIISISSLFPWDLIPNSITIEESRVVFIFRQFLSTQSHSVDIRDISNIIIESSLFFATLQIVSKTYTQNIIRIGNLNKEQAMHAQIIIEGLRSFEEHNIDTSEYEIDELIAKIEEFHTN